MEILDWLLVGFVFLLPVIIWLTIYQLILWRMRKQQISSIPHKSILSLLFIYGGIALEVLTGMLEMYSGMSSLGLLFLIIGAPIICGIVIWANKDNAKLSVYHRAILFAARFYLVVEAILIVFYIIILGIYQKNT